VFNILLQILDEGRLTDSHGRTVDFKNTVITMTSNIGSPLIVDQRDNDQDFEEMKNKVIAQLRNHFRPEFLNRIDDIVVFHALTRADIVKIVELQLRILQQRLDDLKIKLELDAEAETKLAEEGYDPVYGARPLKRVITRRLENPISRMIVAGELTEGMTVAVSVQNGELSFHVLKQ